MGSPLDVLGSATRAALPVAAAANWREPMLATLTDRPFSDPDWLFERKLDGVRALATRDGGGVRLWSRNHKAMDDRYPELVAALGERGGPRFVADGEIVAFDGGQTSFAKLQARIHLTGPERIRRTGVEVYFYLFDLLAYEDAELSGLALVDRKKVLREAFEFSDPLRFSGHRLRDGLRYHADACDRGWEGLIAKRARSRYRSGRSTDWLKFKCVRDQEFVVGGFTDPPGSRAGFRALLVGYYDGGRLRYAGKVGAGFSGATLISLRARLDPLARPKSPFDDPVREPAVHWVRPELVVRIRFTEWTSDGRLRHPRFIGLRTDKVALEVVREEGSARSGSRPPPTR